MSRLPPWAARTLLTGGGVLVALAIAELGARRWSGVEGASLLVNAPNFYDTSIFVADAELGQTLKPGSEGRMHAPEFDTLVRVSAAGTRGADPGSKPPGALRVLAVGDSFTFAVQVQEADTFCAHLTTSLTAALDRPVEVINAGVDAFGTFQATRQAARLGKKLQVDAILLMFFLGNDMADNRTFRSDGYPTNTQLLPSLASPVDTLFSWSSLYFHGSTLWRSLSAASDHGRSWRFRAEAQAFVRGADLRSTVEPTARALRELESLARTLGVPVVVALAPPAFVITPERAQATFALFGVAGEPDVDAPTRAVQSAMPGGMPTVDLSPALRAAEVGGRTYFVFDAHWTARGHRAVADAIVPELEHALRVGQRQGAAP